MLDYTGENEKIYDWCDKVQQINVLHVIDHIGIGGAQRIVSELLNKWNKENIKMFCYVLRASNHEFGTGNKGVFFISNHKSKYNIFSLFELKTFIKAENIKILHIHLQKSLVFGVFIKIFCYKDIKLIVHEHGQIFENGFVYNHFLNVFGNKIDLFIAVSEETKRLLIKNANIKNNKIRMLHNFVDLEYFNSQKIEICRLYEREKLGLNDEDFILGFVGRLSKEKGCDILIKSLPYINIPKLKLVVAGNGVERTRLEKLADNLNIENNIIFLGYVKDVIQLYSLIDCLVVPSRSESFGLSAIEAQALDVPVIASNVNGLNEVVLDKKTGLLFEPGNEKNLAEKIELIYSDEILRMELTKKGLANVKKYSLDNYLITLGKIYENY